MLTLITSCGTTQKRMSPKEYLNWYGSESFVWKASDTVGGMIYSLRFLPREVDFARSALGDTPDLASLRKAYSEKSHTRTFMLEFKSAQWNTDMFSYSDYSKSEMITYLSSTIREDLKGITLKGDSLDCVSIIYEPVLSSRIRLLFTLDSSTDGLAGILFRDRLFSGHPHTFSIQPLTDKLIPSLKL